MAPESEASEVSSETTRGRISFSRMVEPYEHRLISHDMASINPRPNCHVQDNIATTYYYAHRGSGERDGPMGDGGADK